MGMVNWFHNRVMLTPNHTAIVDADYDESFTYQQMEERSEIMANYFVDQGVEKGDRVAILSPNHICYFDFLFACMKIGAIFVPLNWRLSKTELEYLLRDCQPKIIGVNTLLKKKWEEAAYPAQVIEIEDHQYVYRYRSMVRSNGYEMEEESPLAMIYTGGTTGKPKGAVLSHRTMLWNALNTAITWNVTKNDVTLTCLPMFHTGGINVFSLPLLLLGGKVVLSSNFHPEKAVEYLIKYKCTVVLFVPTMYQKIIQTKQFQEAAFPHIRFFISGGAPCPLHIYEAFHRKGLPFKEGYGLTEAGPNNFHIDVEAAYEKKGSVGKPMLFNEIKIVKANGERAKVNEVGELFIKGKHTFQFYWNRQEETADTLKNGWVYTGDLAKQDEDGYVYIVGRKKEMIITGGENVYPQEIEFWLSEHEAIEEAAVIGLPDDLWGEAVTAFIVAKGILEQDELKEYCRKKLASYKIPKHFIYLEELPKTEVGKINKKELAAIGIKQLKIKS